MEQRLVAILPPRRSFGSRGGSFLPVSFSSDATPLTSSPRAATAAATIAVLIPNNLTVVVAFARLFQNCARARPPTIENTQLRNEPHYERARLYGYNRAGFGCNWTCCFMYRNTKARHRYLAIPENRQEFEMYYVRRNRNPLPCNCAAATSQHHSGGNSTHSCS